MQCLFKLLLAVLLWVPCTCLAWDGFDADSADLVEIEPDEIPQIGDTISVKNHDTDATEGGLVMSVKRNSRTIELVVRNPDGREHIFVMEGR